MMKSESYWREAAEDFIRFRKGELSAKELMGRYPEFHMKEGWRLRSGIKEAVELTIPEDCPLSMLATIVRAVRDEYEDINYIHYDIRVPYQTAWEAFPQWGRFKEICEAKESVIFRISLHGPYWRNNLEPCIDIRCLIREGSHGDSDGYGIEDDTWIVGILNEDGTWLHEWYVEGLE